MGDLTLRIRANFDKAQAAFEELADSSAETREQMEKFAKQLEGNEVDEFNRKQKMLQNSLIGTRGETAALEQSVRNYQREIERNIRNGLSPNSDAVRALRTEQEQLQKRIDASRKAQERKTKAMNAAKTALKATAVAAAGLVAGVIALTKRNANLANNLANSARIVGLTTEAYQELDYAMRMSGIENGEYMLNRLNRSVIDVRNETGTLTKYLRDNQQELLEQLQGVENNEEAFTLLMDAIHRAPNEFAAAELAMAAFGRNGAQMVLVAQNGAEGISALREEARELGVVSHANAEAAARFNDAIYRLRVAAQNIAQEFTGNLLPTLTNIVVRLTNLIQRAGEFRARLEGLRGVVATLTPIIAGATAGLTAFFGTMKAVGYITTFINKIRLLTTTLKGATAAALAKAAAKKLLAYVKSLGKFGAVAGLLAAGAMVAAFEGTRRAINGTINAAMELDNVIQDFDFPEISFLAEDIADLDVALTELSWGGARTAVRAIEEVAAATKKAVGYAEKSLRERLMLTEYTATQEKNTQIATIKQFLLERAELESDDREERKEEVRRLKEYLLSHEERFADERYAIAYATEQALRALSKETAEATKKDWMNAYSALFGGLSKLFAVAGREHRAFFLMSRKMALVQAGINTALAITNALANIPPPANIAKAIAVGITGAAQKAKIISSMVPSAETGGRFVVPHSRGVDSGIMRVNPGEEINVTPRGMTGGEAFNFSFVFGETEFAQIINKIARSGELHTLRLSNNY